MRKLAVLAAVVALFAVATAYGGPKNAGTVKLTDPTLALQLIFPTKEKVVVIGKGVSFPEGTYAPESCSLMKQAKDGTVWKLESTSKMMGVLASITVEKGQTTDLDIGPPLIIQAIVYRSMVDKTGKTIIPIGYAIKGKKGEIYSAGIYAGIRKVPAPYFQVLDENSKVLAEGQFEYG